jgi:hypothetical protein
MPVTQKSMVQNSVYKEQRLATPGEKNETSGAE